MGITGDNKKKTTLLVMVIVCIAVIFSFFLKVYVDFSSEDVVINKGVLSFDNRMLKDDEVVSLSGEWEFYWKQFLTHDDFINGLQQNCIFAQVPKVWNKYTINSKHLSGFGYGTYRLHVYADTDSELAIRMPTVSTAYNLYVDDTLLSSNGKISKDKNGFEPGYQPNVVTFKPKSKEFDIIVQVANYSYARGGMWYQLYFGTSKSILNFDQIIQIKDLMLIGSFLMFAVYHMLMFILRRNEKSNLILVFFSLCAAIRVMIYGDYSINYLFPQVGYYGIVKLDYITVALLPFLGVLFVDNVFKGLNIIKFKKYVLKFSLFLAALILVLPIPVFTHLTLLYQCSTFLIGFYAVSFIIKNFKHYEIEKTLFFLGLLIVILSALYDTLFQDNIIKSDLGELSPIGIMIFLIIQSLILAIKNYKAYDELSSAKLKLEQLDVLKDEFLANTAHELRTPLNAIINICEGLYRDTEKRFSKYQRESLYIVINSGKRLSSIVNEILDYSKLKNSNIALNLEGMPTNKIVIRIVNELKRVNSNESVQLITDIPKDIPNILADKNRLIQIFYNLIGNAIKNTEKGYIKVKALSQGEFVKIIIVDTGKGISEDKLSVIFEPYFQVESNQYSNLNGTGLGLAITKKLVEAQGGQINMKSKEGEGTSVSFTIPIYKGEDIKETEQPDEITVQVNDEYKDVFQFPYAYLGKGPTVAIVDDNQVNLISMIGILKANDYSILAFDSVDDFYSEFNKNKNSDLIILDVMLPGLSGYEICESIRKNYSISELPVLMLTAKTATKDIVQGLKSGANDYLAKPFDADEFLARVRTLIQMKLSVEKMRASELSFLRAQIKPHFLFNAINTFITIARYDVEKAVSLMISFSQYLRMSFDFKDASQTTSLKDELELLKAYLKIERARFEERLEIELDLTDKLDIQVPILILQPIVENAIIHGVLPKIEGGKVTVSIKVEGDEALFNIKDNGVGMDLNKTEIDKYVQNKTSVGLKNIDSRLKKLYGKGLIIKSERNIGTSVSWSIPIFKGEGLC